VCHVKDDKDTSLGLSADASASNQLDDHSMSVDAASCASSFCADAMHSADDRSAISPDEALSRSRNKHNPFSMCRCYMLRYIVLCQCRILHSAGKFSDELDQQTDVPVWVLSQSGKSAADDAAFESLHLDQDLTSYIRADISQSECSDEHGQQTDVHVNMSSLPDKRDIDEPTCGFIHLDQHHDAEYVAEKQFQADRIHADVRDADVILR